MATGKVILPLLMIGLIVIGVVFRIKYITERGWVDKEKAKKAVYFMPFGMLAGASLAIVLSVLLSLSPVTALTLGAGIGYGVGYLLYEYYSKKGKDTI